MQLVRGDTAVLNVTITDNTGAAFNLTGYTIKFTAIGAATITKNTTSGITITDATGGKATITLSSTDTAIVGQYQFDIEISDSTHKYTVLISSFQIHDDITK